MESPLFPALADDARLWVYTADRALRDDEAEAMLGRLDAFFADWTSHERPVEGAAHLIERRFLLVAAQVAGGEISGCGIDASTRVLREAAAALGITWMPALSVAYRAADGAVHVVPRPTFRRRVREGAVTAETPVFDTSLTTVGTLRTGGFERPAGRSWHARAFRLPVAAG